MASQMDCTWLEVVPDSGPNRPATPDLSRWHTVHNTVVIGLKQAIGTKQTSHTRLEQVAH